MRLISFIAITAIVLAGRAQAQTTLNVLDSPTTIPTTDPVKDPSYEEWAFSLSAYTYIVPDDRDYLQPTFTADRGSLHLEARYNYENIDTASLWIGCNFDWGDEVTLEFTPMVGGVFGETCGVAPGYKVSLNWWKFDLYTEGEYVFDTNDSSDSFFYTWSELSMSPVDWFRFGVAIQRTKAYVTDFDIQRGFLVGFAYKRLSFTTYVFNPDDSPTLVFGLGIDF